MKTQSIDTYPEIEQIQISKRAFTKANQNLDAKQINLLLINMVKT